MTFAEHATKWLGCRRCPLCQERKQVVLARGPFDPTARRFVLRLPVSIVFAGEAPGESEDSLGLPFTGPAGGLLDKIIARAVPDDIRYCVTNVVACFPAGAKETDDHRPPEEAVRACAPRLAEFIAIARPRLIVAVGAFAEKWLDPKRFEKRGQKLYPFAAAIPQAAIEHPASILRKPIVNRGLAVQRAAVTVAQAIRQHLGGEACQQP